MFVSKLMRNCYGTSELAFIFEVAPRTICKALDSGKIPGVWRVVGGTDRRLSRKSLLAYLDTLEPEQRDWRFKRAAEIEEMRAQVQTKRAARRKERKNYRKPRVVAGE